MLIYCWLKWHALGLNTSKNKNPRSKIHLSFRATTRSNHGSKFTVLLFVPPKRSLLLNTMSLTLALFSRDLEDPYSVEGLKFEFAVSNDIPERLLSTPKCVASKSHHSKTSLHLTTCNWSFMVHPTVRGKYIGNLSLKIVSQLPFATTKIGFFSF